MFAFEIQLLDACVSNCGKTFHLEIASRDFENDLRKLINHFELKIAERMKGLLKKWAENDFKTDPQLNLIPSLYNKLKNEGHDFTSISDAVSIPICKFMHKALIHCKMHTVCVYPFILISSKIRLSLIDTPLCFSYNHIQTA